MEENFTVKALIEEDLEEALELVWRVFLEFEAPDYPRDGIEFFREYIDYSAALARMKTGELFFIGCFLQGKIVGVIALRSQMSHISLLFVQKEYHRQGIARRLMDAALEYARGSAVSCITVHSSPYAVKSYERLGFAATNGEQMENGIRYTPMKRPVEQK